MSTASSHDETERKQKDRQLVTDLAGRIGQTVAGLLGLERIVDKKLSQDAEIENLMVKSN